MRALLVVNPTATTTTERGRDVLVRALRSEFELSVQTTHRRGHAAELARRAATSGIEVMVTLGGDGTVNEVINGLLAGGPGPRVPALAVVPGGSTNVFARALGLPNDWAEATGMILEAVHAGRTRTISLGQADQRYFTFCAGFGLDAEVIRKVERARIRGKVATPARYVRATFSQFFETERKSSMITMGIPSGEVLPGLATVIVQNTSPWTFLGDRPVNPCPEASFDSGLDLVAIRRLSVPAATRLVAQVLGRRTSPHGRDVRTMHDLAEFTLSSTRPLALQLDGDYLGERHLVSFTAVKDALRVIC
jgi:diacylglycerol kinase family enzyme